MIGGEFVPLITLALGGAADAFDRRRPVEGSEIAAALILAGLIVSRTWALYVAAALLAPVTAVRRPPLDALMPRRARELKAATAQRCSSTSRSSPAQRRPA